MNYTFNVLLFLFFGCASFCSANTSPIQKIEVPNGPKVYGAYSKAISVDLENTKNLIFVSGQVPFNSANGKMIETDIHSATNQALDNVDSILQAAGSSWEYVVRMDVFLQNFDRDWDGMNQEYAKRFPKGVFPARQTVGVHMDDDTLIEISCIAIVPKNAE